MAGSRHPPSPETKKQENTGGPVESENAQVENNDPSPLLKGHRVTPPELSHSAINDDVLLEANLRISK